MGGLVTIVMGVIMFCFVVLSLVGYCWRQSGNWWRRATLKS